MWPCTQIEQRGTILSSIEMSICLHAVNHEPPNKQRMPAMPDAVTSSISMLRSYFSRRIQLARVKDKETSDGCRLHEHAMQLVHVLCPILYSRVLYGWLWCSLVANNMIIAHFAIVGLVYHLHVGSSISDWKKNWPSYTSYAVHCQGYLED